jgi:competence protein ComFC
MKKIMEELSELSLLENFLDPILIPIPLSETRYRERGYNQAELVCRNIVKINRNHLSGGESENKNIKLEMAKDVLIKSKNTENQAGIKGRRNRLRNIKGAFSLRFSEGIKTLKDRNIILIDDITTTGATLREARKILREGGARRIIAFTVAH